MRSQDKPFLIMMSGFFILMILILSIQNHTRLTVKETTKWVYVIDRDTYHKGQKEIMERLDRIEHKGQLPGFEGRYGK